MSTISSVDNAKYFVVTIKGKLGPFSIGELRMLWLSGDDLTADTVFIKQVEEINPSTGNLELIEVQGHLGEMRGQLQQLLNRQPAATENKDEELKKDDKIAGKTIIKTAATKTKRKEEKPARDAQAKETDDMDLGVGDWGSSASRKEAKKKAEEKAKKKKDMQKKCILLGMVVILAAYLLANFLMNPTLEGRYVPENQSILPIKNNVGLYLDDLIGLRDMLGVEVETRSWDQSVIPNFNFVATVFETRVYMTQGNKEFIGKLKYVDPSTAYIRLDDFRGHLYISTLNGWNTFRYYGIEYNQVQ